jgi:hypothetical protein
MELWKTLHSLLRGYENLPVGLKTLVISFYKEIDLFSTNLKSKCRTSPLIYSDDSQTKYIQETRSYHALIVVERDYEFS